MTPATQVTSPLAAATPGRAAPSGFAYLDKARSLEVETPEHVRLGFELAGIGSRSAAVLLDILVLGTIVSMLFLAVGALQFFMGNELLANLGFAAIIFLMFLFQWGYFFLAEGFFDGRTLGKRWIGLRVIGEEGVPVTLQGAALRNLIRIIDFQPAGSALLGAVRPSPRRRPLRHWPSVRAGILVSSTSSSATSSGGTP